MAACVDMFSEFEDYIACDNDGQDLDPRSGQVRFDPVTPGSYTVEVFRVPDELAEPASQQIAVSAGQGTAVTFALLPQARTGSVQSASPTSSGAPVEACVDLVSPERGIPRVCNHGTSTTATNIPATCDSSLSLRVITRSKSSVCQHHWWCRQRRQSLCD